MDGSECAMSYRVTPPVSVKGRTNPSVAGLKREGLESLKGVNEQQQLKNLRALRVILCGLCGKK